MGEVVMRFYKVIILSAIAFLIAGCVGQSNNKSAVYVDLAAVANALGRNEVINKQMAAAEKSVNEQLNAIATGLNEQLEKKQKELASKSKKKDGDSIAQFEKNALQVMQNKKIEAQTKINQLKLNLLNQFRDEIKVVAIPMAKAVGADSIVIINVNMLWFDPTLDITADIIAKLSKKK